MALISLTSGSQTSSISSEHSLSQSSGIGVYILTVDTALMEVSDIVTIRVKTKLLPESSFEVAYEETFADVQDIPNKYSVPIPSVNEVNCTLLQSAGTSKVYPWNLLRM